MSEGRPGPGCADLLFRRPCSCPAGGEVALEDYARSLTGGTAATALAGPEPGTTRGVHLCGLASALDAAAVEDVEAFASEMAERAGGGLGWS